MFKNIHVKMKKSNCPFSVCFSGINENAFIILETYCLLGSLFYFCAIILLSSEVDRELGEWCFCFRLLSHFNKTLQSLRNQHIAFSHDLGSRWSMVGKRKY